MFLISIDFKIILFFNLVRKIINILFSKKTKNYTNKNEIISEYIPQDEIKNLIQEDLPFIKNEDKLDNGKLKFKLPSIDLLRIPSRNEKDKSDNEEYIDPKFLEKFF